MKRQGKASPELSDVGFFHDFEVLQESLMSAFLARKPPAPCVILDFTDESLKNVFLKKFKGKKTEWKTGIEG